MCIQHDRSGMMNAYFHCAVRLDDWERSQVELGLAGMSGPSKFCESASYKTFSGNRISP